MSIRQAERQHRLPYKIETCTLNTGTECAISAHRLSFMLSVTGVISHMVHVDHRTALATCILVFVMMWLVHKAAADIELVLSTNAGRKDKLLTSRPIDSATAAGLF